jgi:hypothetical protein
VKYLGEGPLSAASAYSTPQSIRIRCVTEQSCPVSTAGDGWALACRPVEPAVKKVEKGATAGGDNGTRSRISRTVSRSIDNRSALLISRAPAWEPCRFAAPKSLGPVRLQTGGVLVLTPSHCRIFGGSCLVDGGNRSDHALLCPQFVPRVLIIGAALRAFAITNIIDVNSSIF